MNSSTWLALLAAGSFSIQVALAESPDEKAIHDVLDAEIDALSNAHFSRAVSLLHPQAQHLFRDILSAQFELMLRKYSLTQISLVSGLAAHPIGPAFVRSGIFRPCLRTNANAAPGFCRRSNDSPT